MLYKQQVSLDNYFQVPLGLLAQVVPGLTSDLQLRGSSPCINNYPAKKKKKGIIIFKLLLNPTC